MGIITKKIEQDTWQHYQYPLTEERMEIIDGMIYDVSPPSEKHQRVAMGFGNAMFDFFKGSECAPYIAPMDVVLDGNNVVEPDIFVVCDTSKVTEAGIKGPPDLIIEILSSTTSVKDRREKKHAYQLHGVREYIIASPLDETAERFFLDDSGRYGESHIFGWHESFVSLIFPELVFNLRVIFEKEDEKHVADADVPTWVFEALQQSGASE